VSVRPATCVLLPVLLLLGAACEPGPVPPEDCPDEDLYTSNPEHCAEIWCGDPVLEAGTGTASQHTALSGTDGEVIPIVQGPQAGYHLWMSLRTERLCPVMFVRPRLYVAQTIGGAETPMYDTQLHIQAVRPQSGEPEYEDEHPSLQTYWGIRGNVPCEWWPNNPADGAPSCGPDQSTSGYLEDFAVRLEIEAEDHNGRVAVASQWVQPECCQLQQAN
jgi:hypothetical protein